MVDRHKAIQALARRMATERVDAPAPRPPAARIPLPHAHAADLAAGRTHRVRLSAPSMDPARFAAALRAVAARHEALRLGPVRDSGRDFLAAVPHPVSQVDDPAELAQADRAHPLRWAVRSGPDGVSVTLAVSAFLVDRSCWAALLPDLAAAYDGRALPAPHGLEYGDYCYWLAQRDPVDAAPARTVAQELGSPADEAYWSFAGGRPRAVHCRAVASYDGPRDDAAEALAAGLAGALRACGWRGAAVRMQRRRPRRPALPIVGRVDEPVLGLVRPDGGAGAAAPTAAVLDALDPSWTGAAEPLVQLDIDVVDLPELHLGGAPVAVEPVLAAEATEGWHCLLLRRPDGARLYVSGPALTLPSLLDALAGAHRGEDPLTGRDLGAEAPADTRAPGIVTPVRTIARDIVEAAVDRRAAQLRDCGVRPGSPVVVEATAGPETVANLLAALRCRADVLAVDPHDPPAWREALLARLPGAVRVSADNTVHPPAGGAANPTGDGEGAVLLGLSGAPGPAVLARVPLPDLLHGAAALGALWRLRPGQALVVDAAHVSDDLVLKVLAAGVHGAELALLSGPDGTAAVDLLEQFAGCVVDEHLLGDWAVPTHRLPGLRRTRRGVDPGPDGTTVWWAAEAPATQWEVTADGLRPVTGRARAADDGGRTVPVGAAGELVLRVAPGTRYHADPRRTADRLRPCAGGGREQHTGALAGRLAEALRVLQVPADRAVARHRTCLTDAWWALLEGRGIVIAQPPGAPAPETAVVLSPRPVGPVQLPDPLAAAPVLVDRAADGLDAQRAWRVAQARGERRRPARDERWSTRKEAALAAEIVEQVLGAPVGPDDDLFSFGATSLQLMRVLLQVKERTGTEIPLARFFAAPSVATLAELIGTQTDAATAALQVIDEITGES
ncbi:phosphopantetheine-binding protein [Dactylosporangium sp. NPDC000555]|uniref:phosphopantetheine-binding protein n=1 Tax=Dactylosporangium sp. NPDC000555 TaxID=3154260 RepID=UPI00331E526F